MALLTPARRALVDLPLNAFAMPLSAANSDKKFNTRKRSIREVDGLESVPPVSRIRLSSVRLASTVTGETVVDEDIQPGSVIPAINPETSTIVPAKGLSFHIANEKEEIGEGDSQYSSKDSVSSLIDFDPDETTASQQTTATDFTQPSPSRVGRHAELLRLRLRLAHFKIQTNQTNIPLSRLRTSKFNSKGHFIAPAASVVGCPLSAPQLLPAPVLRPTANLSCPLTQGRLPSSPPSSEDYNSPPDNRYEAFRTPALPRHATHFSLQQTRHPSESRRLGGGYGDNDSLTSSAVRGNAANRLLDLRQER